MTVWCQILTSRCMKASSFIRRSAVVLKVGNGCVLSNGLLLLNIIYVEEAILLTQIEKAIHFLRSDKYFHELSSRALIFDHAFFFVDSAFLAMHSKKNATSIAQSWTSLSFRDQFVKWTTSHSGPPPWHVLGRCSGGLFRMDVLGRCSGSFFRMASTFFITASSWRASHPCTGLNTMSSLLYKTTVTPIIWSPISIGIWRYIFVGLGLLKNVAMSSRCSDIKSLKVQLILLSFLFESQKKVYRKEWTYCTTWLALKRTPSIVSLRSSVLELLLKKVDWLVDSTSFKKRWILVGELLVLSWTGSRGIFFNCLLAWRVDCSNSK